MRDSGSVCNLSEVIVRPDDNLATLKEKVRRAAILGTFQSTLTDFRYVRSIWKDNAEEERLLGVSLTGIMDHPVLSGRVHDKEGVKESLGTEEHWLLEDLLEMLADVARDTNKEWAKILEIPAAKQVTLVKPSGTVSQLCGTSSGMHPRYAKYYFRRYAQDLKDPLTDLMIAEGIPYVIKNGKAIFTFPIKSPEGSVCARDMGALEQLRIWKTYREHWCDGNPSQTIYYTDKDFLAVQDWIWNNWDIIGGLSFFPIDDFIYDKEAQPYLEVTQQEYEDAVAKFPQNIKWDNLTLYETEDGTSSAQELACAGGNCEL